ncbi:MAG: CoA-binding protein [Deltaproteobacteria bacterium]|nr:CoA-binding protein [Deltaproteobacteria bacterium]
MQTIIDEVTFMSGKHRHKLSDIFHPQSAAVIGVSPNQMGFATEVVVSLLFVGFPAVYPVNPKYKEVFGLPCYPSVSAIPGNVDHVVVSVPAAKTMERLDDCSRKGVKAVYFFTTGYRETGNRKAALWRRPYCKRPGTAGSASSAPTARASSSRGLVSSYPTRPLS